MTDWAGMQAAVTAALDAAVAGGSGNLIVADNSIIAGSLMRFRSIRERAVPERWAIGEISDCVKVWKAERQWTERPSASPPSTSPPRARRLL